MPPSLTTVLLAMAACTASPQEEPMDYSDALSMLSGPETWCEGARHLTSLGRADALLPLLHAYRSFAEADRLCLLDAMDALGARTAAHTLYDEGDASQRRDAVDLMGLFADDGHLPFLERAVADDDETVRRRAKRALATQVRTPAWHALQERLQASP